jgi:hypothetical protein
MAPKKYRRLSSKERTIIETLLKENRKTAYIAKQLNRFGSTDSAIMDLQDNFDRMFGAAIRNKNSARIFDWATFSTT